jgi:hypothetical protein
MKITDCTSCTKAIKDGDDVLRIQVGYKILHEKGGHTIFFNGDIEDLYMHSHCIGNIVKYRYQKQPDYCSCCKADIMDGEIMVRLTHGSLYNSEVDASGLEYVEDDNRPALIPDYYLCTICATNINESINSLVEALDYNSSFG